MSPCLFSLLQLWTIGSLESRFPQNCGLQSSSKYIGIQSNFKKHIILISKWVISSVIPDQPGWVRQERAKREFQKLKAMEAVEKVTQASLAEVPLTKSQTNQLLISPEIFEQNSV
jgi:hypothetical protein